MKILFTILFSAIFYGGAFCQTKPTINKKVDHRKIQSARPEKRKFSHSLPNLFATYEFEKFQVITKTELKKQQIKSLEKLSFTLCKTGIVSSNQMLNQINFSIHEIEKMKKDDYLFRCFQTISTIDLINVPDVFSVYKTNNLNLFGIIQLLNGQIVFPFKGGLIYAKQKDR